VTFFHSSGLSHEELNSLTCPLPPPHIIEQKYEVIHEGVMYVLSVDREKTRVINKFLSIDYFRKWEKHHVILTDSCITAHCVSRLTGSSANSRTLE
jgi:hypothetical protein